MFDVNEATRSNYYKYMARLYHEAAKAADDVVGHWPGYEVAAPPPVMANCAHVVELSLKAYLLDKGVSEKIVRNFRHDLVGAWDLCVTNGAPTNLIVRSELEIISDLLSSGRVRYGDRSKPGRVPVFGPLSTLCEACLTLCDAPNVSEPIG